MDELLMILPSRDPEKIRVVRVPSDFEEHEAYRHVTALIARIEDENPDYGVDEVTEILADHGFTPVRAIKGPEID